MYIGELVLDGVLVVCTIHTQSRLQEMIVFFVVAQINLLLFNTKNKIIIILNQNVYSYKLCRKPEVHTVSYTEPVNKQHFANTLIVCHVHFPGSYQGSCCKGTDSETFVYEMAAIEIPKTSVWNHTNLKVKNNLIKYVRVNQLSTHFFLKKMIIQRQHLLLIQNNLFSSVFEMNIDF